MRQGKHQADRGETEKLFTPDFYLGEVFTFDTFLLCLSSKNKTAKQELSMNSVVRDFTEKYLYVKLYALPKFLSMVPENYKSKDRSLGCFSLFYRRIEDFWFEIWFGLGKVI